MNKNTEGLCMQCMRKLGSCKTCPHCGDIHPENDQHSLPVGTILQERYIVGKQIDRNSEGIGYIGYDLPNDNVVYIREFMPDKFCNRSENKLDVDIMPNCENIFSEFSEKFLSLSRALARLRDVSGILPVYDIFEQNDTAYRISDFARGVPLDKFISENGGKISWHTAKSLFMPAISTMEFLNKNGLMHLGICPKNLIVTDTGKLKIIGFCINEIRQVNAIIDSELFDGYSSPEQYVVRGRIFANADVYSMCSCILFALSGKKPIGSSNIGTKSKLIIPKAILDTTPQKIIYAFAEGLKVDPIERTHSFDDLKRNLSNIKDLIEENSFEDSNSESKKIRMPMYICASLAIICLIAAISYNVATVNNNRNNGQLKALHNLNSDSSETKNQEEDSYISVPDLTGVMLKDAQIASHSNGKYEVLLSEEEFSDTVVEGRIIKQTPAPGAIVKKGSVVAVNISKGPKLRKLPAVKKLTLSLASSKISAEGFNPKIEEEYSESVAEGLVINYKDYSTGQELPYGSEVIIKVSKGKRR